MRTSMRRPSLSRATWRPRRQYTLATRAMLPSALSVSPLFGDSVHYEIRLDSDYLRALQSSERSLLLEGGPSSQLRSHLMLDPKRVRAIEAVLYFCATSGSSEVRP